MILAVAGLFSFAAVAAQAQESEAAATDGAAATEQVEATEVAVVDAEVDVEGEPLHQVLKQKFIEGSAGWMAAPLLCLIFGLAIAIERIIYLNLSTINTKKLIAKVEAALENGGIEAAKDVCRNTRGPVASIYYQGLDRYNQGLDAVENAVVSYG